ncbi:putative GPI-anchored protein 45 [Candida viswanathii]|uniref:Putative GPI-anchored protein 45 n=1 Tax=Candida viswanathii TaxID=5486 RepID=A0A367XRX2_9ASCO|nr:putative GPI-anchored protein 45 [Candida viswanathii]
MKFIATFLCLFIALANCLPATPTPVPNTDFDFEAEINHYGSEINNFVESNFDGKALALYHEVVNAYKNHSHDFDTKRDLVKRDSALEAQLEAIILLVNNSGIIWDVLDAVADDPSRLQSLSNLTTNFLRNQNITINVAGLLLSAGAVSSNLNLTGLVQAVQESGLVTSILDGILLDENFRPRLVQLIYNVVWSQRDVLLYVFALIAKRDGMLIEDEVYTMLQKRADDTTGGLLSFINNALNSILSSQLLASITSDFLNALNDSGVAVYTIQRFLSTESYINMTAVLARDVVSNINIDFSGFNLTSLVGSALSNPTQIASLIGNLLEGDTSQILGIVGKYASAIGSIIQDLEATGLFAQLNSYVFGDDGPSSIAAASASVENNDRKDVATTSGSSSATGTNRESSSATNGAGALAMANVFSGPDYNTSILKALAAIVGGALLVL